MVATFEKDFAPKSFFAPICFNRAGLEEKCFQCRVGVPGMRTTQAKNLIKLSTRKIFTKKSKSTKGKREGQNTFHIESGFAI